MASPLIKNALLAAASTILCSVVLIAAYEWAMHRKYEKWREEYRVRGDWQGGFTIASPDPVLMWEYRPAATFTHPKYRTVTRTNGFGFRQRDDVSVAKPTGVRRIAFIGDSVTLGREVAFENTFPELVQAKALRAAPQHRLEALNFAIDGYSTPQIARMLSDRVLGFFPDIVVYTLCLNDFDFDDASGEKIRYFRKPASFFLHDMRKLLRRTVASEYHDYYFQRNAVAALADIASMRDAAHRAGAAFQIFVVPVFRDDRVSMTGRIWSHKIESFEVYPLVDLHRKIASALAQKDLPSFDLLPKFVASGGRPIDFSGDIWHLNERGHELVAESIVAVLGLAQ
ncbi:MAG: SGNH/GDSL hydrolase family protein [Burkholderiales bacterium]|nr:SGNH/GDSL hydrolase family protein [Burkholderiales bacterium]